MDVLKTIKTIDFTSNRVKIVTAVLALGLVYVLASWYLKEGFENESGKTVVLYHAPWCGHCKALMPEWNKFQEKGVEGVKIKKVNVDEEKEATKAAGVTGYPTIILYNEGKKEVYTGERTAEALAEWAKSKSK
jgi:protein disulfide-isomerase-like protein